MRAIAGRGKSIGAALAIAVAATALGPVSGAAHADPPTPPVNSDGHPIVDFGNGQSGSQVDKAIDKQQPAALTVSVNGTAAARPGGSGTAQIVVSRRQSPGVAVRAVELVVKPPVGAAIRSVEGAGWACAPSRKNVKCTLSANLASGAVPAALTAQVSYDDSVQPGDTDVTVTADWQEDKTVKGYTGESGTDPHEGARPNRVQNHGSIRVLKPLTVDVVSAQGPAPALNATGADNERQVELIAHVGNAAGQQVTASWSQVGGSQTDFVRDSVIENAPESISQIVTVPPTFVPGEELGYDIAVSANGQVVHKKVSFNPVRGGVGVFAPRTSTLTDLAGASRGPRPAGTGYAKSKAQINPSKITGKSAGVTTGKKIKLKFAAPGTRITSIKWDVSGVKGLKKVRKAGAKLKFTTPKRNLTGLVQATATTSTGAVITETKIVNVTKARPVSSRRCGSATTSLTSAPWSRTSQPAEPPSLSPTAARLRSPRQVQRSTARRPAHRCRSAEPP